MKIVWNKVTWYSKLAAVIVFLATFAIAFWLGMQYQEAQSGWGNGYHRMYPLQVGAPVQGASQNGWY